MLDARAYQRTRAILGFIVGNKKTKRQLILAPTRRSSHPLLIYGFAPPPAWKQVFSQFGSGSQVGASWAIASRHAFRYAGIRPYKYTGIQVYWRTRIKGLTAIQVYGHAATHLHAAIVLSRSLAL